MSELVRIEADCRVCRQGELIFSVNQDDGHLFAECLECLTGYALSFDTNLASGVVLGEPFRLEAVSFDWRPATWDEVDEAR